jgi:hypothetical protein
MKYLLTKTRSNHISNGQNYENGVAWDKYQTKLHCHGNIVINEKSSCIHQIRRTYNALYFPIYGQNLTLIAEEPII